MSDTNLRHPITLKRLVLRIEGMESVRVRRDVEYHRGDAGPLSMDIYYPSASAAAGTVPVVLLVSGYQDVGVPRVLGCAFKEMEMSVSLAQLIASSGMAAIGYTTSEPAADLHRVRDYIAANAEALGLDAARVALWAASGNVPVALSALTATSGRPFRAAVLSNGFTFDAQGSAVADAARTYRFVNASATKSVDDLPDVPLFVVRSGRDEFAGLNDALDQFVSSAIRRNLPVAFVNHPSAPHAFELNDDSPTSRYILEQLLAFMRFHLTR